MKDAIMAALIVTNILTLGSYNLDHVKTEEDKSYERVERLTARERFEVVHWWTQACKTSDKVCNDYYNLNLKRMNKYYPKLAEELDYDNRLKSEKYTVQPLDPKESNIVRPAPGDKR